MLQRLAYGLAIAVCSKGTDGISHVWLQSVNAQTEHSVLVSLITLHVCLLIAAVLVATHNAATAHGNPVAAVVSYAVAYNHAHRTAAQHFCIA